MTDASGFKEQLEAAILLLLQGTAEDPVQSVEQILDVYPSLSKQDEAIVELAFNEYRLRKRRGEFPIEDEYAARFPSVAERLRRMFALDDALSSETMQTVLSVATNSGQTHPQSLVIVKVAEGPLSGQELQFQDHQTLTIGRATQNGLVLPDDQRISRFHCQLQINPPTCSIFDLDSRNGTYVNGLRIKQSELTDGCEVTLGESKLLIKISSAPRQDVLDQHETVLHENIRPVLPDPNVLPEVSGYEIEELIGQGGMGAVYAARRLSNAARVAIKVIRPRMITEREAVIRFCREAAIILRLQHKRIVRGLDFQLTNTNLPVLITEFIDEIPLRTLLEAQPVRQRMEIALGVIVRVLEALQYAHDMEIVHRDLKPSNILAFKAGTKLQVKLADFGLAKNYVDAGFTDCSTSKHVAGSLPYMPPEQIIDCRRAKPSSDIYAAGVCLYQLISNRLPYEADSVASQIALVLNDQPTPITQHVPDVPADLQELIAKAMARDPAERFRTAEEMKERITTILQHIKAGEA